MATNRNLMSPGAAISQQKYWESNLDTLTEHITDEYLAEVRNAVRRDRMAITAAGLLLLWQTTVKETLAASTLLGPEATAYATRNILESDLPDTVYTNMRALTTVATEEGWSARKLDSVMAESFRMDTQSVLDFGALDSPDEGRSLLVPGLVLAGATWGAVVNRIARTTATGLYGDITQAELRENRIVAKKWITRRDGIVRDTHWEAEGTVVATELPFVVGDSTLMYPGDPSGSFEETINCRCVLVGWNLLPEDVGRTPEGRLIILDPNGGN